MAYIFAYPMFYLDVLLVQSYTSIVVLVPSFDWLLYSRSIPRLIARKKMIIFFGIFFNSKVISKNTIWFKNQFLYDISDSTKKIDWTIKGSTTYVAWACVHQPEQVVHFFSIFFVSTQQYNYIQSTCIQVKLLEFVIGDLQINGQWKQISKHKMCFQYTFSLVCYLIYFFN